ncbi:MAG: hypothetical protein K2L19_07280 [Eubacterium sp.]|nr:hypothetical protein [Eubacterium sp.]
MTKKIIAIICCSTLVLCCGLSIAYYNTKSFGFDENAKIFSYDEEKISVMDFEIYYDDISFFIDEVRKIIPENTHTVLVR